MTRSYNANEVAVQADFHFTNTTGANGAICAFVRATAGSEPGTQDSYCALIDVNDGGALHPSLYRTNGGVWQELVSKVSDPNPDDWAELGEWHTIRFAAKDNILTLFISGHKVFNYTDNSGQAITAAGDVAIKTMDGDAYIDNYFTIKCGFGGNDTYVEADLDGNSDVDFADFTILASAWMSSPGDDNWNPDCDISDPKDNIIDMLDLAVLAENWLN